MQSSNIFFYADKTNNIYEMPEQQQKKLDNVTKAYKKLSPKLEASIIFETKKLMNRAAVNYNLIWIVIWIIIYLYIQALV